MKILCVIDSLGSGGAQRQLVELAKKFKERGHLVSFLVYHEINFFKKFLDKVGIKVEVVIEPNYLKRIVKIRRFIRNGNFDSVLSFLEASNFICEISGLPYRKWKLVVGERSADPKILKSLKLKFFRWFHFFADHVVANSNENIRIVKKINPFLSYNKLDVIYNIIDFEKWKPNEDFSPLKENKFNLLVVASHQYLKNAKGLVEAVNLLSEEERKRINIDWYGNESKDGSLNEFKYLIKKYSLSYIFSLHDSIDNIEDKVSVSDALGLFSFYEGLPNIVCEGMSMGKTIISSNVSDIPILLNHNEDLMFSPKQTIEIKNVLSNLLKLSTNELERVGKGNYDRARKLFGSENIVNRYLNKLSKS